MKIKTFFILFILILSSFVFSESNLDKLSKEQILKVISMLHQRKFVDSKEYKVYKYTLDKFFSEEIYKKLEGTPWLGYEHNEGFSFSGDSISIDVISGADLSWKKSFNTFRNALIKTLNLNGYKVVSDSRYSIGIFFVDIKSKPYAGNPPWLWVEFYLKDKVKKRSFFLRYSFASKKGFAKTITFLCQRIIIELRDNATTS